MVMEENYGRVTETLYVNLYILSINLLGTTFTFSLPETFKFYQVNLNFHSRSFQREKQTGRHYNVVTTLDRGRTQENYAPPIYPIKNVYF